MYSASKACLCKFIESVNIELEKSGSPNRILNIAPGYIEGTKFFNAHSENDITKNSQLAEEIIEHVLNRDTIFIPEYNEIYKDVLKRYHDDPHKFGLDSYDYKLSSRAVNTNPSISVGYLSGTFDLFHIGHLNILRRAKEQCDYLIVGVHSSGKWKGKETFISLDERKEIVASCRYVDKVVDSCLEDSDAWDLWHYNKLFVGSDYKNSERFKKYEKILGDKGVEIIYFPYTKTTSSTELRKAIKNANNTLSS